MASECEKLAREGEEASKHSLEIAAGIFEDTSRCFDRQGIRSKAGQYLTLAGDLFLDLNQIEKAAACYGKAIVRYLMNDDIETANILLEKGRDYGFTSATHQYRIAIDAMKRKEREKESLMDVEEEKGESLFEDKILPEIELLPIELEEEEALEYIDIEMLETDEEVQISKKDYVIPQLEDIDPLKMNSFAVLAAVSKSTRKQTSPEIQSDAVVKDRAGDSRYIQPKFSLSPIDSLKLSKDQIADSGHGEDKVLDYETIKNTPMAQSLDNEDTLDLDYSAKTEIVNEYEEELTDIEIIDTIPFEWQVVDVKSDFNLDEKKKTNQGLVFTWKSERLDPGSKLSVEYVLRKRVERSIIIRKENQVSVVNLFQSVNKELKTSLDFVNTTGNLFQEILIEDVIPPELIVKTIEPSLETKPVAIPTHDSTLYRWLISNFPPGEEFSVNYGFREKPLTRYYIDEVEIEKEIIKIEKISQPSLESNQYEYIWLYTIDNPSSKDINLIDRIPSDYDLVSVDPIHLNPSIQQVKTQNLLSWQLSLEERYTVVVIRIQGKESFTPLAPSIEISQVEGNLQLIDQEIFSEQRLIDIRKIKEKRKEIA